MLEGKLDVDASTYQMELGTLARLLAKVIERRWPQDKLSEAPAAATLMTSIHMALHYWNAENFLAYTAENPVAGWHDEHSLVMPLVDRTMLEMVFNVVFMTEDLESRGRLFLQSGWREQKIAFDAYVAAYGTRSGHQWQSYIKKMGDHLETGRVLFQLTEQEALDPEHRIKAWPKPGSMIWYGLANTTPVEQLPPTRQLLHFLREQFYSELSNFAHANGSAQLMQGALAGRMALTAEQSSELALKQFPLQRSQSLFRSSAFLLVVLCEVQQYMQFKENDIEIRLLRIWEVLSAQGEIQEIYDLRYKQLYDLPLIGGLPN